MPTVRGQRGSGVAGGATAEDIRDRLRKTDALLEAAMDEEFARAAEAASQTRTQEGDSAFSGRRESPRFASSGEGDEGGEPARRSRRGYRDDGHDILRRAPAGV